MRYDMERLRGLNVLARDGEIGTIDDIYFEDDSWIVRYLVVDTGGWLTGRKVLVSPHAVLEVAAGEDAVRLGLTQDQVRNSPDFDSARPVSRQFETAFYGYYGYPFYWTGPYLWGSTPYPGVAAGEAPQGTVSREVEEIKAKRREAEDPHLRSAVEVAGYYVEATDGAIGHIESFLVDERSWRVTGIVVDTKNWWPGKHVVIPPSEIDRIDWQEHRVYVNASKARIQSAPEYQAEASAARTV